MRAHIVHTVDDIIGPQVMKEFEHEFLNAYMYKYSFREKLGLRFATLYS